MGIDRRSIYFYMVIPSLHYVLWLISSRFCYVRLVTPALSLPNKVRLALPSVTVALDPIFKCCCRFAPAIVLRSLVEFDDCHPSARSFARENVVIMSNVPVELFLLLPLILPGHLAANKLR